MKIQLRKPKRDHTMSIRVAQETFDRLAKIALEHGTNVSTLARLILEQSLAKGVEIVR